MSVHGKPTARGRAFLARLRKIALAYPETREDHPWEHSAFKVKGKVFVFASADREGFGMGVKLEESHAAALRHPFASPTRYGLGKHGWVSARFTGRETVPFDLLRRWVEESYFAVAPLSVLKKLESDAGVKERSPSPRPGKAARGPRGRASSRGRRPPTA